MEKLDGGRPIVDQRRRVCALEMMGGSRSSFQNPTQKIKRGNYLKIKGRRQREKEERRWQRRKRREREGGTKKWDQTPLGSKRGCEG